MPRSLHTQRRSELAEELFASYLSWRDACESVRAAYRRWVDSAEHKRDLAFATYRAALDLEERAAMIYSERSERLEPLGR